MRKIALNVLLMLGLLVVFSPRAAAQKDFTGIAKYTITVEGDTSKRVDSMAVIFGKAKIKIVFFMPDKHNWGIPQEKVFIDDFTTNSTLDIDIDNGTYSATPMKGDSAFEFKNTNRFSANNRHLCLVYDAKPSKYDEARISKAECLGSIDFFKPGIKNYLFLGVQPLIVDSRIVMDFVVTQKDGLKPKINLYQIIPMENTDAHFDLEGFTLQK